MKLSSCVYAALGCALFAAGCAVPTTRPISLPLPAASIPSFVNVQVVEKGARTVRRVTLEDYVYGSILSEFAPPSGEPATVERMLQVQAVISRTYAVANVGRHSREGFDLCATTHCQLYEPSRVRTSRWSSAAFDAGRKTAASVLWFERAPATAVFHADCGGRTSAAAAVWGGTTFPYLAESSDDGPAVDAHSEWHYEATREALRKALNADARTAVGARLEGVEILDRDAPGRALRLRLKGQRVRDVSGVVFREVATRGLGVRTIKSTWFDVRRQSGSYVFEGRGFGHGVGLCQAGALARIKAGAEPASVLARYFPGTRLVKLR